MQFICGPLEHAITVMQCVISKSYLSYMQTLSSLLCMLEHNHLYKDLQLALIILAVA